MMPKVLITNYVPDEHIEPLIGLAEVIKGPAGGPMCTRSEVLSLAPELVGIINQHELAVDRELLAPMATPNCPTYGRSNCPRQDGRIMTALG